MESAIPCRYETHSNLHPCRGFHAHKRHSRCHGVTTIWRGFGAGWGLQWTASVVSHRRIRTANAPKKNYAKIGAKH